MSNIAGKAYAMNLITPIRWFMAPINKGIFWILGTWIFKSKLRGLLTLSMIHYARWVILSADDFPHLAATQPKEKLKYHYMLFFSNFNGTWEQYVDSFSAAIPSGLNFLWFWNVGWPTAVPEQPFHRYVLHNQRTSDYYYNAYPMAASNDVKAAKRVKDSLVAFIDKTKGASPDAFLSQYQELVRNLQNDVSLMDASPIVSLATAAIADRRARERTIPATSGKVARAAVAASAPPTSQTQPESGKKEQVHG